MPSSTFRQQKGRVELEEPARSLLAGIPPRAAATSGRGRPGRAAMAARGCAPRREILRCARPRGRMPVNTLDGVLDRWTRLMSKMNRRGLPGLYIHWLYYDARDD